MKSSQIPRRQGYGDDAKQRSKSEERLEHWQSERHFAWMDTGLTAEGLERRLPTLRETLRPTPQLDITFLYITYIYLVVSSQLKNFSRIIPLRIKRVSWGARFYR